MTPISGATASIERRRNPVTDEPVRGTNGRPPVNLLEDAVHWLRRAPAGAHLAYLTGTVPFLLGFLWFWADMSRGAFADQRCAVSAGWLAALYMWMKTWHGVYCAILRTRLAPGSSTAWTLGRWLRLMLVQATLQPWGLLLFPLSFLPLMIPTPWVFAFFRHLDAGADEAGGRIGAAVRTAGLEARRWPGQNHGLLGLLLIAGVMIFLNLAVVLSQLPGLVKRLTGWESDFTLSAAALVFNSTFLLAVVAASYLVVCPLVLAVYTLRSFEGASQRTGADLRAALSRLPAASSTLAALALMSTLWLGPAGGVATHAATVGNDPPAPAAPAATPPARLDQAIDQVLARPDFAWRQARELGREPTAADSRNLGRLERFQHWIRRQLRALGAALKAPIQALGRGLSSLLDWLFSSRSAPAKPTARGTDEVDWWSGVQIVLWTFVIGTGIWLLKWVFQRWQNRPQRDHPPVAQAPAAAPDLTAELVSPAALPEDGWIQLAHELAARGEFRLAIRAVYLAQLAHLAQRELVRLGDAKSNRDYQLELARRARARPVIREAFAATVLAFDRVWYGPHAATPEALATAEQRFNELRAVP